MRTVSEVRTSMHIRRDIRHTYEAYMYGVHIRRTHMRTVSEVRTSMHTRRTHKAYM